MSRHMVSMFLLNVCLAGLLSCMQNGFIALYTCSDPVPGHKDAFGMPDPCFMTSKRPVAPLTCEEAGGVCMPLGPAPHWNKSPVVVWQGSSSEPVPACPADASISYKLGRDPKLPSACPSCTCSDPACVLPQGLIADGAPGCGTEGPFMPFLSEENGSCSNDASIEPNQLQSLAVLPPTVTACVGSMAPVPFEVHAEEWNTIALLCLGGEASVCEDSHDKVCVPRAPPGFVECLWSNTQGRTGLECPSGYPNGYVFYEMIDFHAACSPCECSPPTGSNCTATVTAYTSDSCTSDSAFLEAMVDTSTNPPPCYPVQPNLGLKGMTAAWLTDEPGACETIPSHLTGSVQAVESTAWEFCCADPDPPDPESGH